jgi:uncharacterized membrane protein SpoIIM required for sporulation
MGASFSDAAARAAFAEQLLTADAALAAKGRAASLSELHDLLARFHALEHQIAALPAKSQLRFALESVYLRLQERIAHSPSDWRMQLRFFLHQTLPQSFRMSAMPLIVSLALFTLFSLVGWFAVRSEEELAVFFLDPNTMDNVRAGKVWTDQLFSVVPASLLSLGIFVNNIMVALFAFAIGVFFGLGTLYISATNGLMLGALLAFTHQYGVSDRLLNFIVAHGFVELFVICQSAACGLRLGEALINPGSRTRLLALQDAIRITAPLMFAGVVALVVCGFIEGFVSPNPNFSFALKLGIGLAWLLIYLTIISGLYISRSARHTQMMRASA